MNDKLEFRKIREFGEIISDSILFIKQNFKPLIKSFLYLSGIFIVAGLISSVFMQLQIADLQQGFKNGNYSENVSMWTTLFTWRYIFLIVFAILNYTAMYTSVLSFVALYIAKGNVPPSVDEVWEYFKYYFFRVLWGGIIISILWLICFVFCFLPGVYVTPALFLFYAIMILENADFGVAFSRAFYLVKNNWWTTFATIFVVVFITGICSLVVQAPSLIIKMVSVFTHKGHVVEKGFEIFLAASQYLAQIFMIIPLVSSAFIYHSLVERKESLGLLERIKNFGNTSSESLHTEEEY